MVRRVSVICHQRVYSYKPSLPSIYPRFLPIAENFPPESDLQISCPHPQSGKLLRILFYVVKLSKFYYYGQRFGSVIFFADLDLDPTQKNKSGSGSGSWSNLDKNSKFRNFLAFFWKEKFCGFPLSIKKRLKYSNP